jgi:sugar phosphate isomerase/epimerase
MYFGYNTNGFAHHRLEDTLSILAELGYEGVALTLDYHTVNPLEPGWEKTAEKVRRQLEQLKLRCVIETGARFLLDPRRKHWPTLISGREEDRQRRFDFLCRAVDVADRLSADAVSFWSGAPDEAIVGDARFDRLCEQSVHLCDYTAKRNMRLAIEPEPGMLIDTMQRFAELHLIVGEANFGLTLDVGHLHCLGEGPIADHIRRERECLWNVHIEDMRKGVHEHLMFGDGEMDFPPILKALDEIGYEGGVFVELSRHSHDAVNTARKALAFLKEARQAAG